jgi:hypothetical protein
VFSFLVNERPHYPHFILFVKPALGACSCSWSRSFNLSKSGGCLPCFGRRAIYSVPLWLVFQQIIRPITLKAYGYTKEANALTDKTFELVQKSGFHEYFHPFTGEGYGDSNFSWSASLTIDLLATERGIVPV